MLFGVSILFTLIANVFSAGEYLKMPKIRYTNHTIDLEFTTNGEESSCKSILSELEKMSSKVNASCINDKDSKIKVDAYIKGEDLDIFDIIANTTTPSEVYDHVVSISEPGPLAEIIIIGKVGDFSPHWFYPFMKMQRDEIQHYSDGKWMSHFFRNESKAVVYSMQFSIDTKRVYKQKKIINFLRGIANSSVFENTKKLKITVPSKVLDIDKQLMNMVAVILQLKVVQGGIQNCPQLLEAIPMSFEDMFSVNGCFLDREWDKTQISPYLVVNLRAINTTTENMRQLFRSLNFTTITDKSYLDVQFSESDVFVLQGIMKKEFAVSINDNKDVARLVQSQLATMARRYGATINEVVLILPDSNFESFYAKYVVQFPNGTTYITKYKYFDKVDRYYRSIMEDRARVNAAIDIEPMERNVYMELKIEQSRNITEVMCNCFVEYEKTMSSHQFYTHSSKIYENKNVVNVYQSMLFVDKTLDDDLIKMYLRKLFQKPYCGIEQVQHIKLIEGKFEDVQSYRSARKLNELCQDDDYIGNYYTYYEYNLTTSTSIPGDSP